MAHLSLSSPRQAAIVAAVTLLLWMLPCGGEAGAGKSARIHMITFVNQMYEDKFSDSLQAKYKYAQHHGYSFHSFNEDNLDCNKFREVRWRGDLRYCKIRALQVVGAKIKKEKESDTADIRDYLFWHDADTHIMEMHVKLEQFLEHADYAPVVFTDNALSLNNGVFFLEYSDRGRNFFKTWAKYCKKGEWPWADNGCMYEALLHFAYPDKYSGVCAQRYRAKYDPERPEPPTGKELMACFNKEMKDLGSPCCGTEARHLADIAFLTSREAFNHHPCDELKKHYHEEPEDVIEAHCWREGMFLVHSKSDYYIKTSAERARNAFEVSRGRSRSREL